MTTEPETLPGDEVRVAERVAAALEAIARELELIRILLVGPPERPAQASSTGPWLRSHER